VSNGIRLDVLALGLDLIYVRSQAAVKGWSVVCDTLSNMITFVSVSTRRT
jgi:hypothetical protein